jgi:hypothetical protein
MEMHVQLHASADLPQGKKRSLPIQRESGVRLGTLYQRKLSLPGIELQFRPYNQQPNHYTDYNISALKFRLNHIYTLSFLPYPLAVLNIFKYMSVYLENQTQHLNIPGR